MRTRDFLDGLRRIFSDPRLFGGRYVNDGRYLSMHRLHARVCGLLARIGFELGYVVDIGRYYPIDPISGSKGRRQLQAEADISYIGPDSDAPVALLEYESSDADMGKMRKKFDFLGTFVGHTPSVELLALFTTDTAVQQEWVKETAEDRSRFAREELHMLSTGIFQKAHNAKVNLVIGVFGPTELRCRLFSQSGLDSEFNVPSQS